MGGFWATPVPGVLRRPRPGLLLAFLAGYQCMGWRTVGLNALLFLYGSAVTFTLTGHNAPGAAFPNEGMKQLSQVFGVPSRHRSAVLLFLPPLDKFSPQESLRILFYPWPRLSPRNIWDIQKKSHEQKVVSNASRSLVKRAFSCIFLPVL